jgi:hypothetical protein
MALRPSGTVAPEDTTPEATSPPTQRGGEEPPPAEEERQRHGRADRQHTQQDRHRGHLLEIHVAPQPEERDGQSERHQGGEHAQRRRPTVGLPPGHGNQAQERATQHRQAAEEHGVRQRAVPQHLRLGAEPAARDDDRLGDADQQTRDDAGAQTETHVVQDARAQAGQLAGPRLGLPPRPLLGGLELGGRARGLLVVDLLAVHAAVGGSVVRAADHPEQEAEEGGHLTDPEAQRRRHDGRAGADDGAHGQ